FFSNPPQKHPFTNETNHGLKFVTGRIDPIGPTQNIWSDVHAGAYPAFTSKSYTPRIRYVNLDESVSSSTVICVPALSVGPLANANSTFEAGLGTLSPGIDVRARIFPGSSGVPR